jgi:hypothetical protein
MKFIEREDIKVETTDQFYIQLVNEINLKLVGPQSKRAVIVFFDTKKDLMEFYNSNEFSQLRKEGVLILTEEATSAEKENVIRRAVSAG